MTTRGRTRLRRGSRRAQRPVSWENLAFLATHTAAASTTVADLTPEPMQTSHSGVGTATIKRLILHFELTMNGAAISPQLQFLSIGIVVVTRDAIAGLVLPDPESDFNQDWLYWTRRAIKVQATNGGDQLYIWDADIRSMRRLRGGYGLVMISENPVNNQGVLLASSMRCLWSQQA